MDHHAGQHHCYIVPSIVVSIPRGMPTAPNMIVPMSVLGVAVPRMAVPNMAVHMVVSSEGVRCARLTPNMIVSMSVPGVAVPSMAVPNMVVHMVVAGKGVRWARLDSNMIVSVPGMAVHTMFIATVSMSMSMPSTTVSVSEVPWGARRLSWGPSITRRVDIVLDEKLLVNLQVVLRLHFVER